MDNIMFSHNGPVARHCVFVSSDRIWRDLLWFQPNFAQQ